MCVRLFRFRRNEQGTTAVEMAILMPPLFALMFGVVQLGWMLHCASSVRFALEQEARTLTFDPEMTATELQNAVRETLNNVADDAVTVTLNQQTVNGVTMRQARAAYVASLDVPLVGHFPVEFEAFVTVPGAS